MRKVLGFLSILCVLAFAVPTANADVPGAWGVFYQNTVTPGDGFNMVAPVKSGSAQCKSIFFLVGVGDCSVRQAMKNGGITQLSHYDVQRENILGIQTITVKAYGK